jgi:hypothetical protein
VLWLGCTLWTGNGGGNATMRRSSNSPLSYVAVIIGVILFLELGVGIPILGTLQMKMTEGIQIISKKGIQVLENVKFEQIKTAGIRLTQQSWEAFLQICDRLVLSLGHLTVYADIEARIMFVYNPSSQPQEVYYVTF